MDQMKEKQSQSQRARSPRLKQEALRSRIQGPESLRALSQCPRQSRLMAENRLKKIERHYERRNFRSVFFMYIFVETAEQ